MKRHIAHLSLIAFALALNSGCSKKSVPSNGDMPSNATSSSNSGGNSGDHAGASTGAPQPGSPSIHAGSNGSANSAVNTPASNTPAAPLQKQCFVAEFKPKGKVNGEMSTAILSMKDLDFNQKSICVRVNGNPIKYKTQLKKGSKKIESIKLVDFHVATAKVTVSYCLGKDSCNEECKIPKDEFMDALGAADDSANKGWGDAAEAEMVGKVSADIQKELADDSEDIAQLIQSAENPACGNALAVR